MALKTLKPESQVGAQVESNAEGISPGPCAGHPGALKVKKVKLQSNPPRTPGPEALQREIGTPAKLLKLRSIMLEYTQAFSLERFSQTIICCFEALQLSLRGV